LELSCFDGYLTVKYILPDFSPNWSIYITREVSSAVSTAIGVVARKLVYTKTCASASRADIVIVSTER